MLERTILIIKRFLSSYILFIIIFDNVYYTTILKLILLGVNKQIFIARYFIELDQFYITIFFNITSNLNINILFMYFINY